MIEDEFESGEEDISEQPDSMSFGNNNINQIENADEANNNKTSSYVRRTS